MKPIQPRVPEGSKVYSFLYPTIDPEFLTQDVLAISLPSGFHIDVGWFPQHDPNGWYTIRVFYHSWDVQHISPIRVKTVEEVVLAVEHLSERFNSDVVATSSNSCSYSSSAFQTDHVLVVA